jgi:hypothetical protein
MVPQALYLRSLVGDHLSVGVVKFVAPEATRLPVKEHAHGEEVSLQVEGGCSVFQGIAGETPVHQVELDAGTVMIIPADQPHYGHNRYAPSGVSLRINVASPPRADFGSKGAARVTYHALEEQAR